MKYYKRLGIWKNSTGTLELEPVSMTATSYNWYVLSKKCVNYPTQVILNTYRYSNTTARHVRDLAALLQSEYNITPIRVEAPNGLQDKEATIVHYKQLIAILREEINKKGSRKSKNLERLSKIAEYDAMIKFIEGEL